MRLLILTPQFPFPPHQGTTLRNFNLLRNLAQRHAIALFSLLAPGDDPAAGPVPGLVKQLVTYPQPQRNTQQRLRDLLLSPLPDMALRLWDERAFDLLLAHVRAHPPELIQIEGIEMAPYLLALKQAIPDLPILLYDAHNAETLLQKRSFQADLRRPRRWPAAAYSAIQTVKLGRYERRFLRAVDGAAAVSETDAAALRKLAPSAVPAVIPNGVDAHYYDPAADYPNPFASPGPHLVFTGKMDFRPNVDGVLWFAERVLPALSPAHFWIVGRNPHPRLDALRARPDVTITGPVPDVRPYIAHADLYVIPLLAGSGSRLKVLEAMAMARPMVATTVGAEGFPLRDGEHLALADDPAAFAAACRRVLADPVAARAMAERARAFVVQNYEWERIVPRLEHLYLTTRRWNRKSLT